MDTSHDHEVVSIYAYTDEQIDELCTKVGEGDPKCCNTILEVQEPRNLPSSD